MTTIQGQPAGAVGSVSATPDDATVASIKEITDAINQSAIDINKNNLQGNTSIVDAVNKLTGVVQTPVTNPATGLPVTTVGTNAIARISATGQLPSGGGVSSGLSGSINPTDALYQRKLKAYEASIKGIDQSSVSDPMYTQGYGSAVRATGGRTSGGNQTSSGVAPSGRYAQSITPFNGYGGSSGPDYASYPDYSSPSSSFDTGYDPNVSAGSDYQPFSAAGYDPNVSAGSDYQPFSPLGNSSGNDTSAMDYGGGYTGGSFPQYDTMGSATGGTDTYDAGYFATGGTFTVPGSPSSGIDKTLVTLHATPGETIMVAPNGSTPPSGVTMPTLPSQASPTAVAALANAPAATQSITNKTINIQVQAGIQAESFIRSRAQIARGM